MLNIFSCLTSCVECIFLSNLLCCSQLPPSSGPALTEAAPPCTRESQTFYYEYAAWIDLDFGFPTFCFCFRLHQCCMLCTVLYCTLYMTLEQKYSIIYNIYTVVAYVKAEPVVVGSCATLYGRYSWALKCTVVR